MRRNSTENHNSHSALLARLNNNGACFSNQGRFDDAIEMYTMGLKLIKELLSTDHVSFFPTSPSFSSSDSLSPSSATPPPTNDRLNATFTTPCSAIASRLADSCSEILSLQALDDDYENSNVHEELARNAVYTDPIYIHSHEIDLCSYNTFSFLFMFNLALCHHLNALANTHMTEQLDSALSLYELAYAIHLQEEIAGTTVLHSCAIVNNIGQIKRIKNDEAAAHKCFEHLLAMLMFVVDCGRSDEDFVSDQFDFFFSSVSDIILKDSSIAPAA